MGVNYALILKYNRRWTKIGTVGCHIWERRGGLVAQRRWRCEIWVLIKGLNLFHRTRYNGRSWRGPKWDSSTTGGVSDNSKQIEIKVCWVIKLNGVEWTQFSPCSGLVCVDLSHDFQKWPTDRKFPKQAESTQSHAFGQYREGSTYGVPVWRGVASPVVLEADVLLGTWSCYYRFELPRLRSWKWLRSIITSNYLYNLFILSLCFSSFLRNVITFLNLSINSGQISSILTIFPHGGLR